MNCGPGPPRTPSNATYAIQRRSPRASLLALRRLLRRGGLLLGLLLVCARDNLVDAQQHRRRLNGGFERLHLDGEGLPHAERSHVGERPLLAVDAPADVLAARVLGAQLRQHADDIGATVLEQRARDHLERSGRSAVGVGDDGLLPLRIVDEVVGNGHFGGASARKQPRVEIDGAQRIHRVAQITLHLVEHVLRGAAQHNRARLGRVAIDKEGEPLVAQLRHLEEPALGADVLVLDLRDAVDDGRP
mmetsp:Transcript_28816/g.67579  ORF Transcript_28816/g.67579 Transcript_28816/m.67579 type:complete len:246 (+) Transcript_28816:440-1177(+)